MALPLRSHQRRLAGVAQAIASGAAGDLRDVLAAVTPGGGKSLLPVIAAARLVEAGIVRKVCWVCPRDSLRQQAEEAFTDPRWREVLGHALTLRSAGNAPDPSRGLDGYVTTYQAIAVAPDLHLREFRSAPYLLVLDEVHHLPALPDAEPVSGAAASEEARWSRAVLPLLELARVRLLLSGTLERADGRGILWLPYRTGTKTRTHEVDLEAPGLAVIGYSRSQALAERAVLPITFGAIDGEAEWLDADRNRVGPHRLSGGIETTRAALFTALRTEFADALLDEAFLATRRLRAERRQAMGLAPGEPGRGLGKLLVVAPDQALARRYLERIRRRLPEGARETAARLAISDAPDAQTALAAFRLQAEPSILVTVAMAYEGLDAPETSVVAALTHVRSRPWLEQMAARATRIDPRAGPVEGQRALIFHPDDLLFRRFKEKMEVEQGTLARQVRRREQGALPLWLECETDREPDIVPLNSNALTLRYDTLAPGPDFAALRPEHADPRTRLDELPSILERKLRHRIGEMVAAQVVEEEVEHHRLVPGGANYHRLNAVLKRIMGNRARSEMTAAQLEVAVGWLERNRLVDHLHVLQDDPRYAYRERQLALWGRHQRPGAGGAEGPKGWQPPVGRRDRHGRRATAGS
jgi:superfamily II DNA or RNA helicase